MKKLTVLALFLMPVAAELNAAVLTFDISGLPNGYIISNDYGDRVSCSQIGNFHYGLESGVTPNITVTYAGDHTWSAFPTFWTTGYNDLYNVIENESDGDTGYQVIFQADPNVIVQLKSFDVGNWGGQLNVPEIRVTNSDGTILFQTTNVTLPASSVKQHVHFDMPPDVRGTKLILRVDTTNLGGASDNIGLDNICFSQDPPVPRPSVDIDNNGIVDLNDLIYLIEYWLVLPAPVNLDVVVDCRIDLNDFAWLASFWMTAPLL
ncbi:MAG: hypothetical protein JXB18_06055 [Sedimentisphaerales bacterium]|nr:hypothetical protein [Sedimentisphaerales bacterium]